MFSSLRYRILSLFILSILVSASALLYALAQFENIGNGLYLINAAYLPISEETTKLEIIVFQLQREQDQLSQTKEKTQAFLNAEFYIKELREGLERTQTIIRLSEKANFPIHPKGLTTLQEKNNEALNQLDAYQQSWQDWNNFAQRNPSQKQNLEKEKRKLVLAIRQLASTISAEIIQVSQQTEHARKRAQNWSSVLAVLATIFWVSLVVVALRTLRPIEHITTQVTRLKKGERVEMMAGKVAKEITVLLEEFNSMADAVAERDYRLSERAKALNHLSNRLQQAIDSIRIGLFVVENNQISLVNHSAKKMWRMKLHDSPPSWLPEPAQGEFEIDEKIIQIDSSIFGDSGKIFVTEDITQKHKVREQLNRSQRLATIGKMLAQVTHEIRNPLNAMSLNAEMLADEDLSDIGKEMLEIISNEIHQLEKTTARYLDLSRPKNPYPEQYNPENIIKTLLQAEEIHSDIQFQFIGESSDCYLDQDSFRRCVRNLFRNSKEAQAQNIIISFFNHEKELEIHIADDGIGLETETEEHLFEPFFTTKASGTGLGLSISRQELESFGAILRLIPSTSGSCFSLTIPKTKHMIHAS